MVWVCAWALLCPVAAYAERDAPVVEPGDLSAALAGPYQELTGQAGDLAFRTEAARRLIEAGGSDAELALSASLGPAYRAEVWRATLDALNTTRLSLPSRRGGELPDVLVGMRRRLPADLEQVWAAVLGRYELEQVVDELAVIARDPRAPLEQRRLAIIGMGHHRRAFAASVLMGLTEARELGEVQAWAFEALATLSHQPQLGRDRAAWGRWWSWARGLNRTEWQRELHESLLLLTADQRARDRRLRDRLVESQRQLYRATRDEDKPIVLAGMLSDTLEPIRDLGMDLASRRLEDGEAFPEHVRAALRLALGDVAPQVREQAATLLGQLADEPGVQMMADRLALGEETSVEVQRQYLLALRRIPNARAVQPAYEMLADRALQPEAAGALATAAQAGLIDETTRRRVRLRVLEALVDVQIPQADIVLLLGRVLGANDREWMRVERWLKSSDERVRDAAARVWVAADRPLVALARQIGDPVIRPVALRAIREHGHQPDTLRAVVTQIRLDEIDAADLELWHQALIAMADRVRASLLLEVIDDIAQYPADTRAVRVEMLTRAIERADRPDPPDQAYLYLLLARAETLVLADAADLVVLDYEAALAHLGLLRFDDQARLYRGLTAAYLAEQNAAGAFETAKFVLHDAEGNPRPAASNDALILSFISAIRQANRLGDPPFARVLLTGLRDLLGTGITAEIGQRLSDLEREIDAPPPVAPVAPVLSEPENSAG